MLGKQSKERRLAHLFRAFARIAVDRENATVSEREPAIRKGVFGVMVRETASHAAATASGRRTRRCTTTGAAFYFRATPRRCSGPGG